MPADTFSALLGLLEQGTGNNNNTWGNLLNSGVMDKVDLAIAGLATYAVTGGTLDLSGTPPPAGPSGAIQAILNFNGVLGSNQIVQVPNLSKIWLVQNSTTGAFTLKFKTPAGAAGAAIPQGGWCIVFCDGANNIVIGISTTAQTVQFLGANGSVAAPSYAWASETSSGWYRAGAGDLRFSAAGTDILQIASPAVSPPNGAVNVLASQLLLQGVQVIPPGITSPYVGIAAPTGWLFCAGQAISRTTNAPLFNAMTTTVTANTHTNTTVDNISFDLRGSGVSGVLVEGSGIPAGTTLTLTGASTGTLSAAALSSLTGTIIRLIPYGQGDASTTFNVPDLRGRSISGRDDMLGTAASRITTNNGAKLNTAAGEENHALINSEIPGHTHAVFLNDPGHPHNLTGTVAGLFGGGAWTPAGGGTDGAVTATLSATTGITVRDQTGGGGTANQTATAGGATPPGGATHNNMPPFEICNYIIKT